MSNEELVKLYQSGDKTALEQLIQANTGNKYNGINIELEFDDLFKKEILYRKSIKYIKHDISVSFEDLGLVQCNATNGRKITQPMFAKVSLYAVFKFYINLEIVFRDKNKKYYTLEEAEQRIIAYYKKNNIEYEF